MTAPVIAGVEITTDAEGRFNLNALHRASGKGKEKAPNKWLGNKQVKELITELEGNLLKNIQAPNSGLTQKVVNSIHGGTSPGTFAHELLAIEYAGWISPAFRLQVNQTFLDYRTGKLVPPAAFDSRDASTTEVQFLRRELELTRELYAQQREINALRTELAQLKVKPTDTVLHSLPQSQPTSTAGELALERERDQLAAMLGRSKDYATISAVERVIEREFSWHPLRKWCLVHHEEPVYLKKYGCAWPRGAWLKVYGVNLEELFG
ncbi:KilA-N domain-containing protein [Pseudocitrobacter sp. RIT415]|nr:KilA-N domain-containing protein [Pseudocitrobacter sp. RIT 415]